VEKKGIPVLIKACRRLIERGCREFQVEIVGTGPLAAHTQNVVRGSGLQNHVRLVGAKRHLEISRRLQGANAFVLPCVRAEDGDHDVLPVTIIEALACGLPVVSTTVGGIAEVVKDGVNGILAAPEDPDSLAQRMEALIRNPELYERLRTRARDSVAPRFSRERTAASLHEILDWAAANRRAPTGLAAWWDRLRNRGEPSPEEVDAEIDAANARARTGTSG
jgi:glycosyltransferase involved in cell wall biosynthesis